MPEMHPSTSEQNEPLGSMELIHRRAEEIENAIDPEHTLPSVEVIINPNLAVPSGSLTPVEHLIVQGGNVIGECTIVSDKTKKERWFHGVKVDEALRGQGYGMATYKTVIRQAILDGFDFRTEDWSQTTAAKKIWEALAQRGVAQAIDEFTPVTTDRFNGHYVVSATNNALLAAK